MNWSVVWVTRAFPASWEVVQARHHFQEGESPPRNHREEGNSLFQNDTSKPQMVVSAALDAPWPWARLTSCQIFGTSGQTRAGAAVPMRIRSNT